MHRHSGRLVTGPPQPAGVAQPIAAGPHYARELATTDIAMSFHEQVRQTEATALVEEFGIVAGRLQQFAETLQVSPERVLQAIDFDPLVDTANRASAHETYDRPTDPELRSLAMTSDQFARLSAALLTDMKEAA